MVNRKIKLVFLTIFIVFAGLLLRLWGLNKPEGLWNDEYVSWYIASVPFGKSFWSAIVAQCHMPFYYFYLKFFMHFLGNSDYTLRLTSVLPGVLSIISMFFVGREFEKDKHDIDNKLALLCATVTSISSFLIYYSQEVRFYSLLFLFASLSLLFTLKVLKNQSRSNILGYIVSNFLIIVTHTIGFVFVFFNLIFVSFVLMRENEQLKKKVLTVGGSLFLVTLIVSPLLFSIMTNHPFSQWWGHFSFSKIGFLVSDYFSPVLTNLVNAPDNFFYNFTYGFLIFAIIPSLISIVGIVKAISTKNREILGLFFVSLSFVVVMVIMSILGKLVFITKYSIEIYPILILIMAFGLLEFKQGIRNFLIFSFCILSITYIALWPTSATRIPRAEGHKLVADLLSSSALKNNDFIILTYYDNERFEKYFNFDKYNVVSINKTSFWDYLGLQPRDSNNKFKNDKQLKTNFKNIQDKNFDAKFDSEVLSKLKKNQKVVVVMLNSVSMFSPMMVQAIVSNENAYRKTPFYFLVFSQVKNDVLRNGLAHLQLQKVKQSGSWCVVTFVKK